MKRSVIGKGDVSFWIILGSNIIEEIYCLIKDWFLEKISLQLGAFNFWRHAFLSLHFSMDNPPPV